MSKRQDEQIKSLIKDLIGFIYKIPGMNDAAQRDMLIADLPTNWNFTRHPQKARLDIESILRTASSYGTKINEDTKESEYALRIIMESLEPSLRGSELEVQLNAFLERFQRIMESIPDTPPPLPPPPDDPKIPIFSRKLKDFIDFLLKDYSGREFIIVTSISTLIFSLGSFVPYGSLILEDGKRELSRLNPFTSDLKLCNQSLNGKLKREVNRIISTCERLRKDDIANSNDLVSAGRASLVLYGLERNKDHYIDSIRYFNLAKNRSEEENLDTRAPRIVFYREFMKDFAAQVFAEGTPCKKIYDESDEFSSDDENRKGRYSNSIDLYTEKDYEFKQDDFFILVELAHFLINRDENHTIAVKLLDIIPEPNQESDNFYRKLYAEHVVLSKAIAKALSHDIESAQSILNAHEDSFKDHYKIDFYRANMDIQLGNYKDAAQKYSSLINRGGGLLFYKAQRNYALSVYLNVLVSDTDKVNSYQSVLNELNVTLDYGNIDSIDTLSNIEYLRNIKKQLESCNGVNCEPQNIEDEKQRTIDLITQNSYYIIHEGTTDPFFDIEHDKFYCLSSQS